MNWKPFSETYMYGVVWNDLVYMLKIKPFSWIVIYETVKENGRFGNDAELILLFVWK